MERFEDKVAFITGAASGIGFGMARALLAVGAKVIISDIRKDSLESALGSLNGGERAHAVVLDVADRNAWAGAADEAERRFGTLDILCSNAGVNFPVHVADATIDDWDYCLRVNLMGAINAVTTLIPRMRSHGKGGHVVITSSVSGLYTGASSGVYSTSKYALVALGESLRADLAKYGIGVSVLCPGPVQSELFESTDQLRPANLANTAKMDVVPAGTSRSETPIFRYGMTGAEVGERVIRGIGRNDMYIMTHSNIRSILNARHAALLASLPDEPEDPVRHEAISAVLLEESLYIEQLRKPSPRFP
jgi:NAD(P)-dependent dehydrogenase (short-subunit alcohol dehydrogenase family)